MTTPSTTLANSNAPIRVLTGIKPTGSPHLGNYVGAIRPAIQASLRDGASSFFFLADYHALIGNEDATKVQQATLEITATWLALGLDPARVIFYRQSDVPETAELCWLLGCVAAKGLLNRAHAYKAAVDANSEAGLDLDHGVNAGLYTYPVLMAADILLFNANLVPVGKDQVQHIEIARDIAARFNHLFATDAPIFTLPEASVDAHTAVLPGLDGRKMSKSYGNTIPLWLDSKHLKQAIAGVVTNSKLPGEPKHVDESALFAIYQGFATPDQAHAMQQRYSDGIGWGEVKAIVTDAIEQELATARVRYAALIADPAALERTLLEGAARARAIAAPFIARVRAACGLRSLADLNANTAESATNRSGLDKKARQAPPKLSTFKDSEGFRFKLSQVDTKLVLLESIAFDDAKSCGVAMAALKTAPESCFRAIELGCEFEFDGIVLANGGGSVAQVLAQLALLREDS